MRTEGAKTGPMLHDAMDWLLRLREAPTDAQLHAAFEHWLSGDPAHAAAWQQAMESWRLLGETLPTTRQFWPTGEAAPRVRSGPRRRARWKRMAVPAMTALAACLLLWLAPLIGHRMTADYMTATAETRLVSLDDGSTVMLGPESAIALGFDGTARRVSLIGGSAYFDVTPDPDRPFIVLAQGVEVRVVGTAFSVDTTERRVSVAVAHGVVGVRLPASGEAQRLEAGQSLAVDLADGTTVAGDVLPEDVATWRQGTLFVSDATVAEVAEILGRYHAGWIVLADADLSDARVTGLYDLSQPRRALEALVRPAGGAVHAVTPLLFVVTHPDP